MSAQHCRSTDRRNGKYSVYTLVKLVTGNGIQTTPNLVITLHVKKHSDSPQNLKIWKSGVDHQTRKSPILFDSPFHTGKFMFLTQPKTIYILLISVEK